ncbi:MAG: hypothetical protein AAFU41_09065 [Pseudomonadota bacterium]
MSGADDMTCLCPPKFRGDLDAFGRPVRKIFAEYRVDLFEGMASRLPFAHWQLGQGDDMGMMVLDWVAYMMDNLAFYNDAWTREQHLLTATQEASLTQLAKLTGYAPRPNLAATSRLVAISDAKAPFEVGASLGFSSEGGDDHGALQFETVGTATVDPALNGMTAIMPRETVFDPEFVAIGTTSRNLRADEPVLFLSGGTAEVAMLQEIKSEKFPSGEAYGELVLDKQLTAFSGTPIADMTVHSFSNAQQAAKKAIKAGVPSETLADAASLPMSKGTGTTLEIPGVHPNYHNGQRLVIQDLDTGDLKLVSLKTVSYESSELIPGDNPVVSPFTYLELHQVLANASQYMVYSRTARGGHLIGAPKTHTTLAEFSGQIELVEKYTGDNPDHSGDFVVTDAQETSVLITANMSVHPHSSRATLEMTEIGDDSVLLKAPLKVHGNFLDVDQGKTVVETLGSTSGRRYQHFRLGQKPLTYLRQPDSDPLPAIELFINNVPWRYATHLLGLSDDDTVFTLKMEPDGQATLILGGAPKAGNQNVVVRYRFGTTGENPGAQTINKPAGKIDGISKVFNPFKALGGLPGDGAEDIRYVLPWRVAANDRCVSSEDYSVLARNFGALSAKTRSYWNPVRKQAAVETMVIFDGGLDAPLADKLRIYLTNHAPEESLVSVVEALPVDGDITLKIRTEEGVVADDVKATVEAHYLDKFQGQLALRRIVIGHAYNRAEILGPLVAIQGLLRVEELMLNGDPHLPEFPIGAGEYLQATVTVEVLT